MQTLALSFPTLHQLLQTIPLLLHQLTLASLYLSSLPQLLHRCREPPLRPLLPQPGQHLLLTQESCCGCRCFTSLKLQGSSMHFCHFLLQHCQTLGACCPMLSTPEPDLPHPFTHSPQQLFTPPSRVQSSCFSVCPSDSHHFVPLFPRQYLQHSRHPTASLPPLLSHL